MDTQDSLPVEAPPLSPGDNECDMKMAAYSPPSDVESAGDDGATSSDYPSPADLKPPSEKAHFADPVRIPYDLAEELYQLIAAIPKRKWHGDSRKYIKSDENPQKMPCVAFGLTTSRVSPGLHMAASIWDAQLRHIFDRLVQIVKLWPDQRFCWTSMHIMDSYHTKLHVDGGNCMPALTFSLVTGSGVGMRDMPPSSQLLRKLQVGLASSLS